MRKPNIKSLTENEVRAALRRAEELGWVEREPVLYPVYGVPVASPVDPDNSILLTDRVKARLLQLQKARRVLSTLNKEALLALCDYAGLVLDGRKATLVARLMTCLDR